MVKRNVNLHTNICEHKCCHCKHRLSHEVIEKLILNDVTPFHVQWSGMRRKKCGVPTGFIGVMAANQHWTQYKCSRYTKLQCGQGHKRLSLSDT